MQLEELQYSGAILELNVHCKQVTWVTFFQLGLMSWLGPKQYIGRKSVYDNLIKIAIKNKWKTNK